MGGSLLEVEVDGGRLTARRWGDAPPVLAIHGITASHMAWSALAQRVPGVVAADLRGRGGSADLPGPWGLARHADDMVHVIDAVGLDRAVVVGHSMGGAVAVTLAHRHPERVERLVLVDGGLTLPPPPGVPKEEMLEATIGPAAQRLSMTFASREAYRDFWRAHPGLGPAWNDLIEAYVDYDLTGEPPSMRSRTSYDAVRADSIDMHTGTDHPKALEALTHQAVFLRAERGLLDEPTALFSQEQVDAEIARRPNLTGRTIPGTNHYTIAMTDPGVSAVAAEC